jgi:hypothetical protein
MKIYKATPEQWAMLEEQSAPEYDSTILELRARVEALEANLSAGLTSSNPSLVEQVAAALADADAPVDLWYDDARAVLLLIADEVERRGDKGLDLDPGETADWLRSEANQTSKEN